MYNSMNKSNGCMWTAWGDVVCPPVKKMSGSSAIKGKKSMEHFLPGANIPANPSTCSGDLDCNAVSRCDNLNVDAKKWKCRPCSDIGCIATKQCGCVPGDPTCQGDGGSSDCAEGLSCQNNVCTVGGVPTNINQSTYRTTPVDTDTIAKSYEVKRQAYITQEASADPNVRDCAMLGTCQQGQPCDNDSLTAQCASGLMCDLNGLCQVSYGRL